MSNRKIKVYKALYKVGIKIRDKVHYSFFFIKYQINQSIPRLTHKLKVSCLILVSIKGRILSRPTRWFIRAKLNTYLGF